MNIFITGATGFIGNHVVKNLAKKGHSIRCLVGRGNHIQELEKIQADLVWGDPRDRKILREGMAGCNAVIHMAGIHSFWETDKKAYTAWNVHATKNVMETSLEAHVSRVIHMSSPYTYGRPATSPFIEESPIGMYRFNEFSRTMLEGDRISWNYFYKNDLPLTTFYPAIALGPGRTHEDSSLISRFLNHPLIAKSCLNAVHSFVHVGDIAEAVARMLEKEESIGEKYFISGERMTLRRLLANMSTIIGHRLPRTVIPELLARSSAQIITFMAGRLDKTPPAAATPEYLLTMQNGMSADGTKAQKELGITYTPIIEAIREEIAYTQRAASINEKRRSRRHAVNMDIVYKAQGESSETRGRLSDISESGALIYTAMPCPKGRYLSINLSEKKEEGDAFLVRGHVVRSSAYGIAVDFTHKDRGIRQMVESRQRAAQQGSS